MKLGLKLSRKDKQNKKKAVQTRKPKAASTSLETTFLTLFIVFSIMIFIGAFIVFEQLRASLNVGQKENTSALVSSYARQIEQTLNQYTSVMEQITKEPGLIQDIRNINQSALREREAQLAYMFPQALRISILPPELDEPEQGNKPLISYACLDQIHKSRHSKHATAEAHLVGKPNQHIAIVRSIKAGGQVIGNLMITLPLQAIKQAVNKMNASGGLLALEQTNKRNQSISLTTRGNVGLKQGPATISAKINKTSWQMSFWAGKTGATLKGTNTYLFWGIVGAIWIIFSLFMFILYKRVHKALMSDQVMILKLFKDIQHEEMSSNYPIALKNCMGVMEQLLMIAGEMTGLRKQSRKQHSRQEHESNEPSVQAPSNDDVVGLGFANNTDALEVHEISDSSTFDTLPASIFKAYDIRGIYNETLNDEIVQKIGRALGSEAQERGQQKVVVARDGRLSGPELSQALIRGLQQTGREVIDIGRVPTPVLYFASHYLGNGSGVMLTGSHNPPEYNGLKMMLRGDTLHDEAITGLRERIEQDRLVSGEGSTQTVDVVPSYIERVTSDVRLSRPLKIVVDCGNGVAGEIAPQLYRALGCEVIDMFCEIDGNFPNHHPDPSKPENMIPLSRAVLEQGADLGLAFDGDGDRLGVIDSSGKIIWPDRYLMLLAIDVLQRQPGAQIIFDVKCSRDLEKIISENGGQALMWKTGHSFIKSKMLETGAQLAGEMSGHIFFKERWLGFDDALYAGARLMEVLSADSNPTSAVFAQLPENVSTPELNISMPEGEHFQLMEKLKSSAQFPAARLVDIDGLRIEFEDGWGLIRASNTTPSLVLRFEAEDASALGRIQDIVRTQLLSIQSDLDLPF